MKKFPVNLSDTAFDSIKNRIQNGTYNANQKLVISALAKEFGVSTIPIREALAKLNAIDLVVYKPNQGYRVAANAGSQKVVESEQSNTDKEIKLPRPEAVKQALAIFSDSWSFAVLEELFFGVRRFDDFQRNLSISRSVLTRRLKHLTQQKIIERQRYSTRPERFEYKLTERGRDMYPIFVSLQQWGEQWLEGADSENLKLIHKPCEHELKLSVTCSHCLEKVEAVDVRYELIED